MLGVKKMIFTSFKKMNNVLSFVFFTLLILFLCVIANNLLVLNLNINLSSNEISCFENSFLFSEIESAITVLNTTFFALVCLGRKDELLCLKENIVKENIQVKKEVVIQETTKKNVCMRI